MVLITVIWNQTSNFFFFQSSLAILDPPHFHINFRINVSISTKTYSSLGFLFSLFTTSGIKCSCSFNPHFNEVYVQFLISCFYIVPEFQTHIWSISILNSTCPIIKSIMFSPEPDILPTVFNCVVSSQWSQIYLTAEPKKSTDQRLHWSFWKHGPQVERQNRHLCNRSSN